MEARFHVGSEGTTGRKLTTTTLISIGFVLNSRSFRISSTSASTPVGQGKIDQEKHILKSLRLDASSAFSANINPFMNTYISHQFSLLHSEVKGPSIQEVGMENITGKNTKFCQKPNTG